jgi:hypothetical protein
MWDCVRSKKSVRDNLSYRWFHATIKSRLLGLPGLIFGLMRTLCGAWIKLCVGRAREAPRSERAHTSAFSGILGV